MGTMADSDGSLKYPQWFALMKSVLSLNHGNAVPERSFSVENIMLESPGYTIGNGTIAALRLVKDSIRKKGGMDKFPISRKLHSYSLNHLQSSGSISHQRVGKMKEKEISNCRKKLLQLLLRQESKSLKSASCTWKLQMKSSLMVTDVGVALEFLKKTLVRKAAKTVQTKS